jgi:CheY-like chemotaxis protein/DNA-binding XRE family transcriptional regulator
VEFLFNSCIFLSRLIAQPDLKKGFGAELRRRRIASGISQERLAELADLHRTYISAVESGRRNLTLESIQRLATALGASVGSFFSSVEGLADEALKRAENRDRDGEGQQAGTILLVEDDPRDVEFTQAAFKAAKLANPVEVVADGAAALELLAHRAGSAKPESRSFPQLVLLDLHLPKIHGLEVLRRIKADRRLQQVPIVVLTASRSDRDIQEAMRLGASAYLIKPVDFQRFAEITPKLSFHWALL